MKPKVLVVLGLLFAIAHAEHKINLEDIESDNLRAEAKSSSDSIQAEETSYNAAGKQEILGQKYQQQTQEYQSDDEGRSNYAPQEHLDQDKYAGRPEEYQQDAKYSTNDVQYQQSSQPIQQQYVDYQQQVETSLPKSLSHAAHYEQPQQQLYYQQEIHVGNQYQSEQQKTAAEKYAKHSDKETQYVNIPMTQLLSYYPNLALHQPSTPKDQAQPLFHRLANLARQIAIPIYKPSLSRDPIYSPSKAAYQFQPQYSPYTSKYPQHTEAIFPTKSPKKLIYTQSLLSHEQPQVHQQHYQQELVYTQQNPGAVAYAPTVSPSQASDAYPHTPSAHLEANSLSQTYAGQTTHQQQYATYSHQPAAHYPVPEATYAPQLQNQIYQQQIAEGVPQNYEAVPVNPASGFDLPKLPAQNFKPATTHEPVPVSHGNEQPYYTPIQSIHSSGPTSLLDSYVPSHVLAAQDSDRYRERPIKLESGFLPSKINFVQSYNKRKAQ